jgi:hypothetical protein
MDPPVDDDPCTPRPVTPGGSAEIGLGSDFTPITDGQDAATVLGAQGLVMFISSARTLDMNVGSGDLEGVVVFTAFDENNQQVSIDFRCRLREFLPHPGATGPSYRYMTEQFNLAFEMSFTSRLEGAAVTLQLDVQDVDGRKATSRRTVIAHLPQ